MVHFFHERSLLIFYILGSLGVIFAHGLGSQTSRVVSKVDEILSHNRRITLNCLGLSRGGIACLMLANKLCEHQHIDINLLLFDPVSLIFLFLFINQFT